MIPKTALFHHPAGKHIHPTWHYFIFLLLLALIFPAMLFYYKVDSNVFGRTRSIISDMAMENGPSLAELYGDVGPGSGLRVYPQPDPQPSLFPQPSPAVPDHPILVHILGYQRTGSSFLGGLLDRGVPGSFYLYEPLGQLYSAMYGTRDNRPVDLLHDGSGIRSSDTDETSAITSMMDALFTCNMTSLPVPLLVDSLWSIFRHNMTHVPNYLQCLSKGGIQINSKTTPCMNIIEDLCPGRFTANSADQENCKKVLWNSGKWASNSTIWRQYFPQTSYLWERYFLCLDGIKDTVIDCARHYLDRPCERSQIVGLKTVRASADISKFMLQKYPNFRLVHIFRKPHTTVLSQKSWFWTKSLHENSPIYGRAKNYCSELLHNYRIVEELKRQYTNRVVQVPYDIFVRNISRYGSDFFSFIGYPTISEESRSYIETQHKKYAKHRLQNNKQHLTYAESQQVAHICRQVYHEVRAFSYMNAGEVN